MIDIAPTCNSGMPTPKKPGRAAGRDGGGRRGPGRGCKKGRIEGGEVESSVVQDACHAALVTDVVLECVFLELRNVVDYCRVQQVRDSALPPLRWDAHGSHQCTR